MKSELKRFYQRAAAMLLMMLLTTTTAWATVGDIVASGTCGEYLNWTLTENEDAAVTISEISYTALTLTISGTGAMYDYTSSANSPWNATNTYRNRVTKLVLPNGITHIGNHAFYFINFSGTLTIPEGVETIGDHGFYCFNYATSVTLPASVTSIGEKAFRSVGSETTGCTFTATTGSQLSSIGTEAFRNFGGDVDLRNCTSLTTIGVDVFKEYKTNTLYLPVSMRTVAANAIYPGSTIGDKPKVYVAYANSAVTAVSTKGAYTYGGTEGDFKITTAFNIQKSSSAAVSIKQICFDDINLTWNSTGKYFAIADEQDLIDLANYVSGTDHNYADFTFKMTADLDFSEISHTAVNNEYGIGNFMPIGMLSNRFLGHFDGQGHTITGLYFSAGAYSAGRSTTRFGRESWKSAR